MTTSMSNDETPDSPMDAGLNEVGREIRQLDPTGQRWSKVIRHTYDMIYNGHETGRFRWDQLMKTEKTHFGTLFEINSQREFNFAGGTATDFLIAGHQVDAKWSQTNGSWMLPPEVVGEIALVATGSDENSRWSLGLVRVRRDVLRDSSNRDQKSQLNAAGRQAVTWLWQDAALRPDVLLQLAPNTVDRIMSHPHGTERVNDLFRSAEGKIISRTAVATVGRQLDHQKRIRYNGGARSALQPEGILIMSGQYHRELANQLGLPVPLPDEYVSARVVPSSTGEGVLIGGRRWRRALPGEPVATPAPRISASSEPTPPLAPASASKQQRLRHRTGPGRSSRH